MRIREVFTRLRGGLRKSNTTDRNLKRTTPRRRPFGIEPLDERVLLSAVLFVDFGDAFPGGVLNTTVAAVDDTTNGSNPNIDGPRLSDPDGDDYGDDVAVAITSFNSVYGTNTTERDQDRADIMAMVRRFYDPFDIQVIDLTTAAQTIPGTGVSAQAATSLNDVSATLGLLASHDSYIIMGLWAIGPGMDNPATFADNGYGGLATGTDTPGNNDNDGTALVMMRAFANRYSEEFLGAQVGHESGHLWGLQHTFGNDPSSAAGIDEELLESDLMSYLGYTTHGGINVFSRYPMVQGDGNTDNDTLAAASGQVTQYDQMRADPNIGPSNMEYVTGTGAHDIITITKAGASTGTVTVQAFLNSDYTGAFEVPGSDTDGSTYTYTIDLTKPLLIDAGSRNDRVVLDADLGNTITLRAMHGTDELLIMGKNAATGSYVPGTNTTDGIDDNDDYRGSLVIGSTTINFHEFETTSRVLVQDIGAFTFRTPLVTDLLTLDSPVAGRNRVTGTSNGVDLVPMTFFNVTTLVVDTATFDGGAGNDRLTLTSSGFVATGLANVTYNAGTGNDLLVLNASSYALPGSGTFAYNGGGGTDEVQANSDSNFTLSDLSLTISGGGSVALTSVERALLVAAASANTFAVSNWTGIATLRGAGGNDQYTVDFVGSGSGSVTVDDASGATDTLTVNGTANADTINIGTATVTRGSETVTHSGVDTLTVDAKAGADTLNINNTGPVTSVLGGSGDDDFVVNGTGAAGVTLNGQADSDDYTVNFGSLAGIVEVADTPPLNVFDRLFVNGTSAADVLLVAPLFVQRGTERVNYSGIEQLTVNAGDGDDDITVDGTSVPTIVNGENGDDDFTVNGVMDAALTLNGGPGTDSLLINGTSGDDVIILTDSSITGLGANITFTSIENLAVDAGAGNDTVDGSALTMSVTIFGGTGNDLLIGGSNDDQLFGEEDNDRLHGNAGDDLLDGGTGNDALFGDAGDDELLGGDGDDHLYGGTGNDLHDGNAGADIAYGGDGDDTLIADQAGDYLLDWLGNFNNFIVPDPSFGAPVVIRIPAPMVRNFLIDLATADGSSDPEGELSLVIPGSEDQRPNSGRGGRPK